MTLDKSPTDAVHELEDLIDKLMKGQRDPTAAKAARGRMDRMREETRKRAGIVDVAVPFIRKLRDK